MWNGKWGDAMVLCVINGLDGWPQKNNGEQWRDDRGLDCSQRVLNGLWVHSGGFVRSLIGLVYREQ